MPADHDSYDDALLRDILTTTRSIAVVGASDDPRRPSFGVLQALVQRGYRVFGVNPSLAADAIAGVTTYPSLSAIPEPVDMVDVFRNRAAVPGVVDEALALSPRPKVIWLQLGLRDDAVAARAEGEGVRVVMDRCPKIEIPRLFGRA